jgi:hypothetical protein
MTARGQETDVVLDGLANLGGKLQITTADGITLTSAAGLGTSRLPAPMPATH